MPQAIPAASCVQQALAQQFGAPEKWRPSLMLTTPVSTCPGAKPELLSLRGAASFLGLHPNTVRAQVRRGIIPGTKLGRSWRFVEADLVAWIRSHYPEAARVQLSALEREAIWHSTDVQVSITSNSQPGRNPH